MQGKQLFALLGALCVGAACGAAACGGSSAAPASPSPTFRALTGLVTETEPTQTTPVANARVSIDDGPNAGKSATTDATGRYAIRELVDSTFSLRATAPGYVERAGSIVLSEDRDLNFQLLPVLRTVTDAIDTIVTNCNGATYIVCYAYDFGMHHVGAVSASIALSGSNEDVQLSIGHVETGFPFRADTHRAPYSGTKNFCSGCPIGKYQFRVVGRVLGQLRVSVQLTHPN